MFWLPMAIGAGVGLVKNQADKQRAQRMNEAAAVQTMWSPHSGMGAGQISLAPSGLEAAMQGGMAGAQFGLAGQEAGWWGGDWGKKANAAANAGAGSAGASAAQAAPKTSFMPEKTPLMNASPGSLNDRYFVQNKNNFGMDWFGG